MRYKLEKVTKGNRVRYEVSSWLKIHGKFGGDLLNYHEEFRTLFFAKRCYDKLVNYTPPIHKVEKLYEHNEDILPS